MGIEALGVELLKGVAGGVAKEAMTSIAAAWKSRRAPTLAAQDSELAAVYDDVLHLLGSILHETRANVDFLRLLDETHGAYAPLTFSVTDALFPEFCRSATTPQVIESLRWVIAACKRVDFFQRAAGAARIELDGSGQLINDDLRYQRAVAFARDALSKNLVGRYNALVEFTHDLGRAVHKDKWIAETASIPQPLAGKIAHNAL